MLYRWVIGGAAGISLLIGIQYLNSHNRERGKERISSTTPVFVVPLKASDTPLVLPQDRLGGKMFDGAIGGVVPHHLAASVLLSEFFTLLRNQKPLPETIVLLAPNHGELSVGNIQVVDAFWKTALGDVETDRELLQSIENAGGIVAPSSFENEHGVYNVVPYIASFLPGVKVVPVILKYKTSSEEIEVLAQTLATEMIKKHVFVVSSVDFSHYLSQSEAERKDTETISAIESFDVSRIAKFESDHLDSPAAILVLLRIGQIFGATGVHVLRHDNSAENIRSRNVSTTSHFTFTLRPKP